MMTAHNNVELNTKLASVQSSQRALLVLLCLDSVWDTKKNMDAEVTETEMFNAEPLA
jgi:hypothetical protein